MKPLTLEETALKEEMKERCLTKGQYIDENAKAKFEMLCHLEDFEVQYWELQQENKILRENAENNDKVVDKVNWENMLLKKENKQLKKQLDKYENPEDMTLMMMWCTEKVKDENQALKKQVEDKEDYINKLQATKDKLDKWDYENTMQQKEFIKWKKDYLKLFDNMCIDEKGYYDMLEEILNKYKEIIGENDE